MRKGRAAILADGGPGAGSDGIRWDLVASCGIWLGSHGRRLGRRKESESADPSPLIAKEVDRHADPREAAPIAAGAAVTLGHVILAPTEEAEEAVKAAPGRQVARVVEALPSRRTWWRRGRMRTCSE